MALDGLSTLEQSNTLAPTATSAQAPLPVCTHCQRTITRENFGKAYRMWQGHTRRWVEVAECRQCTGMLAGEIPAEIFLQRHHL